MQSVCVLIRAQSFGFSVRKEPKTIKYVFVPLIPALKIQNLTRLKLMIVRKTNVFQMFLEKCFVFVHFPVGLCIVTQAICILMEVFFFAK